MIVENSSYRDYHSIVGFEGSDVKRLLHRDYLPHYQKLIASGLYNCLTEKKILVAHREQQSKLNPDYPVELLPDRIPFISYPYEWTFSQLKDAAILTLEINRIALEYGMILKDASNFNVQFVGPNPIFIDTASFVKYEEGQTWTAYQQFCRHFLAPLALSHYGDIQLRKLLLANLDGIPLSLCKKILPTKSWFNSGMFLHIWLNELGQSFSLTHRENKKVSFTQSKKKLLAVQEHLLTSIKALNTKVDKSQWANYYEHTNYSKSDMVQKEEIVSKMTQQLNIRSILDLGANDGRYSRLLAKQANFVLSTDYDEVATDINYRITKAQSIKNVQTLHLDFVNPTPATGFANKERKSFLERVKVDLVLALALVHNLTITHDISFEHLAEQLAKIGKYLIIEFPLPEDKKVQIIARNKQNQFRFYKKDLFDYAFSKYFLLIQEEVVENNGRRILLFQRKSNNTDIFNS